MSGIVIGWHGDHYASVMIAGAIVPPPSGAMVWNAQEVAALQAQA